MHRNALWNVGLAVACAAALLAADAGAGEVPSGFGVVLNDVTSAYDFVSFPLVTRIAPLDGQLVAATFIGGNFDSLYAIDADANLVTVDTTTGAEAVIGPLGISPQQRVSLAADPGSGSLFAVVGDGNCFVTLLYSVSTVDGSAELVAPLPECVAAVAADVNNQLLYFLDTGASALSVIDVDGNETTLGPLGIAMNASARIMIDPVSGGLFMTLFEFPSVANSLYEIDTTTGAATFVMGIGGANPLGAPALAAPSGTIVDRIFANGFDPAGLARAWAHRSPGTD
jgi:hypothetical protein